MSEIINWFITDPLGIGILLVFITLILNEFYLKFKKINILKIICLYLIIKPFNFLIKLIKNIILNIRFKIKWIIVKRYFIKKNYNNIICLDDVEIKFMLNIKNDTLIFNVDSVISIDNSKYQRLLVSPLSYNFYLKDRFALSEYKIKHGLILLYEFIKRNKCINDNINKRLNKKYKINIIWEDYHDTDITINKTYNKDELFIIDVILSNKKELIIRDIKQLFKNVK